MSVVDEVFASLGLDDPPGEHEAETGGGKFASAIGKVMRSRPGRPAPPHRGATVTRKGRPGGELRSVVTKVTNKKKLWQYLIEHNVNHRADCNAYTFDDNNAFMAKRAGRGVHRLNAGRRIPVDYPHDPVVFCDQNGYTMVGDLPSVVRTVAIIQAKAIVGQQASGVLGVPDAVAWLQANFPQTFVGLASRVLGVEFGSGTSCVELEHPAPHSWSGTPDEPPATVAGWYPLANKTHFGPRVTEHLGVVNAASNRYEVLNGRGDFEGAQRVAEAFTPGTLKPEWQAAMWLDQMVKHKFHILNMLPDADKLLNGTSPWFPCVQAIGLGEYRLDRSINIEMRAIANVPHTEPEDRGPIYTKYGDLLGQGGIPLASYNLLRDAHWVFLSCRNCNPGEVGSSAFAFAHEVPDEAYARASGLPWNAEWAQPSPDLIGMDNARGGYLYMILCCSSGAGVGSELGIRTAMLACSLGYTRYVLAAAPAPASLYYKSGLRFCNRRNGVVVDTSAFESPPGSGTLVTSATLPRARGPGPYNERAVGGLSQ